MIVALHVATGAATGALMRSRIAALAMGPLLHVASDRVPHRHPSHPSLDYLTGLLAVGALAARRGVSDAATVGAFAAVVPDLEHLIPALRPRGMKVFHRRRGGDRRSTGLSPGAQMILAGVILAPLVLRERRDAANDAATVSNEADG
jgi:hypothetical protein